ncbi:MAG: molybdopterin cofactor-binding domain-containing protein, partial [Pseudomonadota bacterium]
EPRAAIAIPTPGGLHLILPTQAPWRTRDLIADALGIPAENVRVEAPDVGGAFGMKASPLAEEVILASAAITLQTPLRWVSDRSEDFLGAPQGRGGSLEGTLLIDRNGRFLGLTARVAMPMGHMLTRSALVPLWNAARILPGPYTVAAMDVAGEATADRFAPVGIYRGAGRPEAALFMERLVDCAAAKLGADPLDLRRANITRHFPARRHADARLDSGDYGALLDRAAQLSAWDSLLAERDRERAAGTLTGVGIAMFVEPSGQGSETARVRLGEDGAIIVSLGSTDQGQGRAELVRTFAADTLKVRAPQVVVRLGDTDVQRDGLGALASRSTPIGMPSLLNALNEFATAARTAAAAELGEAIDTLRLGPSGVAGATATVPWARLAEHDIDVTHTYEATHEAWGSGVAVASVDVDSDTGTVAVRSLFAVDDAGKLIDPQRAFAQVIGGATQGLGEALMEQLVYDDGELLTGSFMDYAMPRAEDVPPIVHHSIQTLAPDNPIGGKGIGEAGCIGVPAAILNAVHDALSPLGVADLTFPLTPSRVWDAMAAARRSPDTS